ncbi:patatin-like phospholipase family protein [Paracidovorax citrulli]|uniref:Patatin n=2 Tax=Paracidovorax citrulli TaxID=80869 RepID=A1TNY0_PARC0|nr:patatin-like phospholipase family protein [Paracidovorax citrulli]ABM32668.1 Patatin [Paracidovorax citrulli AAC00-1]ATG93332.1 Patatin [Paracidovorax citrulli]PVY66885.1 NTE family protein [Paracidovorax citrulli]QCX09210.1 NTE family protein RssA [Paracidovorax citrulli]REG68952.1 NTE family protein [Paracidovorax citrulli]
MRSNALLRPLVLLSAAALAACGSAPPAAPSAAPAQAAAAPSPAPIKVGIALGGGAAKGFAHIGVIKMLEANGLAPAVVAGTSAGSVVGALYASGMNAFELQEKAVALDEAKIRDLQLSSGGLVLGQKLEDYVNAQVRNRPIEQLAKPFAAVATRLEDGERTVFTRGNTGQAVRASSSIPGVFQPVAAGKYHFVDGGVVSPVPVDAARQLGADIVVAVDISNKARGQAPADMLGTLGQSIAIMGQKLGQAELARADVVVRPQVLDIGAADFTQRAGAILEGEKAALAAMPQIRERVAQLQAARAEATRLAQQKAAEAQHQACLEQRSRLQKLAGLAGLDGSCPAAAP